MIKKKNYTLIVVSSALLAITSSKAADGTWLGNSNWWSDPASWVSGQTPDGVDGIANFTGVNITGNINKSLGGNRTIGNITFTDTTPTHNLALLDNILTLDVSTGSPQINVTNSGRTLTISSTVAGNDGLTKTGAGILSLTNTSNTFTGNILVSAGELSVNGVANAATPATTTLGNTEIVGRTLTVSSGAFLTFANRDSMGTGGSAPKLKIIANGGTVRTSSAGLHSIGALELNGGTLNYANSAGTNQGFRITGDIVVGGTTVSTISGNALALNGNRTFTVADSVAGSGSDLNVTTPIINIFGTSGIIKAGVGTMTLTSTGNTYTGPTTINAGTFRVNGNSGTGSAFTVASGGTLAGTGTVGSTVAVSGNIAPGDTGIGTLNTGSVTWNRGTGTAWQFNLGDSNASDKLAITGNFNKGTGSSGSWAFDFMNSSKEGVFTLATWTTNSGTPFTAGDLGNFSATNLGTGVFSGGFSITGNTLQFTAVPEASNLLIGALVGLGVFKRRRKNS